MPESFKHRWNNSATLSPLLSNVGATLGPATIPTRALSAGEAFLVICPFLFIVFYFNIVKMTEAREMEKES